MDTFVNRELNDFVLVSVTSVVKMPTIVKALLTVVEALLTVAALLTFKALLPSLRHRYVIRYECDVS